jgi:PAS domain S-box-containing protein
MSALPHSLNGRPVALRETPGQACQETHRPVATLYLSLGILFWALYIALDRSTVAFQIWTGISAWYPPAALTLALLLGISPRYAPLVLVVAASSEALVYGQSLNTFSAIAATVAFVAGYTAAAIFLRRVIRIDWRFGRLRDVAWFVTVSCIAALGIATVGVACLVHNGTVPSKDYWTAVLNWATGDAVALVCLVPILLVYVIPVIRHALGMPAPVADYISIATKAARPRKATWERLEFLGQGLAIGVALWLVFSVRAGPRYQLFYLCFVPVIWIAARQGLPGTTIGLLVTNLGALLAFRVFHLELQGLARTQMVMFVVSLTGLCLGALMSEKTSTEDALLEQKTLLDALIENSPVAIYFCDSDLRVRKCNPAFEHLFQYTQSEILGAELGDLLVPEDLKTQFSAIKQRAQLGETFYLATQRQRKDGAILDVELFGTTVKIRGVEVGRLGLYQDVTALARSAKELKRSNAELEQFAYVASHDLQEPLRMITSFSGLLAQECQDRLTPEAEEYVGYITDGAKRMRALIHDLLAYARVGSQGKKLTPTDCDAVAERALGHLEAAIGESGAEVTRQTLPVVEGDESQLVQLFQNLIGNAIKFRGHQPPRVHVSARRNGHEWIFSVRDNGIGIDPQYAERIFVIFQRLHNRREYAGTGMGLAICKKIVERHGGRIWVESQPGNGCAFCFSIPGEAVAAHPESEDSLTSQEMVTT